MKTVRAIFIDEHNSSKQNGIGTFRDTLLPALSAIRGIEVALLSLNSDVSAPTVIRRDFGTQFALPMLNDGNWRALGEKICRILRKKIRDSRSNVFIVNHSPCIDFIKTLRQNYPKSKVVFVIHDMGWSAPLLGSSKLLKKIVIDGILPKCVSEGTAKQVTDYLHKEQEIYSVSDWVVCLSPSTAQVLKEIYRVDDDKISLIPNGYSTNQAAKPICRSRARRRLGIGNDEELLIFAERPVRYKGIEALLMAVNRLRKSRPRLRCVMCGSMSAFGNFEELITKAAPGLIFTGLIPKHELRWWYAAANVGVMPSYSEQFGYSGIEMANAGLRLVASDGHGLRDMFRNEENAFVAPIGADVTDLDFYSHSLENAITKALDASPTQARQMTAACKHMIADNYSAEKMAESYARMLTELVNVNDSTSNEKVA